MEKVEIACMTSRGQVVIPQKIREDLHLQDGEKFAVIGHDDMIILKKIEKPSARDFQDMLERIRMRVKEAGITPKDVEDAIKKARSKK